MRDEADLIVLVIVGVIVCISLAIHVLFLLTLHRCLARIQPHNRDMQPGMVWLNLVPCLNIVWIFLTVIWIGSSLQKEYRWRRILSSGENFGVGIGIAYAVCVVISSIPYVGCLGGLPALICFIIYWVQIANYGRTLASTPARRNLPDDNFDDDWDNDVPPAPRSNRADDSRIRPEPGSDDRYRDDDDRYRAERP